MTVRVHTPGFAFLAEVAIAYAQTFAHGERVGLAEAEIRAAVGERLAINAELGLTTDWGLLCDRLTDIAHEKSRKDRRMTVVDSGEPDHDCPGGCDRTVPHHLLACPGCWSLLPVDLRKAVTRARGSQKNPPQTKWVMGDRFGGYPG
jgi:hypothetical protein